MVMNIYEEQGVETTFDELTDLLEQLVMNMMVKSLRNIVNSHQAYQDIAESRSEPKQTELF
jgi:hypothetical protein